MFVAVCRSWSLCVVRCLVVVVVNGLSLRVAVVCWLIACLLRWCVAVVCSCLLLVVALSFAVDCWCVIVVGLSFVFVVVWRGCWLLFVLGMN